MFRVKFIALLFGILAYSFRGGLAFASGENEQVKAQVAGQCPFELAKLSSLKESELEKVCHRPNVNNPNITLLMPNRGDCVIAYESARSAAKVADHIKSRQVSFSGLAGLKEGNSSLGQACAFASAEEMAVQSNRYVNENLVANAKALETISEEIGITMGTILARNESFRREIPQLESQLRNASEAQRKFTYFGLETQLEEAKKDYPKIEKEVRNGMDCQKKSRRLLDIVFQLSADTKDKLTSPPMVNLLPAEDRERQRRIATNANDAGRIRSEMEQMTEECLKKSILCKGVGNAVRRSPLIGVIFGALGAADAEEKGLSPQDQVKTFVNGANPLSFAARFQTSTDLILKGKSQDLCGKELK